jgi:CRISPR-associated endonuclease/helicase Cas3
MAELDRLLAKSSKTGEPRAHETLAGHTAAVMSSADALLELCGEASLAAVGLPIAKWIERLSRIVRLACLVHDLGKANDQFQAMLRRARAAEQAMRHEAVSLWLSWPGQLLAPWLRPAVLEDVDYLCAITAAAGHHRKFWSRAIAKADGAGTQLVVLVSHPDFHNTLKLGGQLGLGAPPVFSEDVHVTFTPVEPARSFSKWERAADSLRRGELARLLGVAKAITLAADVAGSCLPKARQGASWVREQLSATSNGVSLEALVAKRLAQHAPRPFQVAVADADAPVSLVRAGCGSGKTAAAYLWAARQHAERKLWVTYPTTGTATEGFRDYLFGAELDARLEHSRANIDAEVFGLRDQDGFLQSQDRLEAIRVWGCDAVACTVDTVLGVVQNHRKSLYAWPSLARASVVFDEVHAYDRGLFDALLHFLEAFPGIPALLMTASLPEDRLERLRAVVRKVHAQRLHEVDGPESLETLPRYRQSHDDVWELVGEALGRGKKVLWVSNTVARCMQVADHATKRGYDPLVYHSRFRYVDRVERHGSVVRSFDGKHNPGAALAVTTQVAEMSLDLSADLLVTDLAPVPALIQRLGRLNRRSTPEAPHGCKPFVVLPFKGLPYGDEDLAAANAWLVRLGELRRDISQRDLSHAWSPGTATVVAPTPSTFRHGGFSTEVGELREATPGITVLLAEDAALVRAGIASAIARALPMGIGSMNTAEWAKVDFYPVAPKDSIDYDPKRGGQWRDQ